MSNQKIGPFTVERFIHRDANLAYAQGRSEEGASVLLCLLHKEYSSVGSTSPIEGEFSFTSLAREDVIHERLLHPLGFGEVGNWNLLVFPFISALPLWLLIDRETTLRRRDALLITKQVAEVLEALHNSYKRSTDINVATVFIKEEDGNKEAYLLYGSSLPKKAYINLFKKNEQLTRFHVISPEEAFGPGPTNQSDIFQLGGLLTTMLTRRMLVLTPTIRSMGQSAVDDGLYPGSQFTSGLPRGVFEFVNRAMAADPLDRFQRVSEALAAMKGGSKKLGAARVLTQAVSASIKRVFDKTGELLWQRKKRMVKERQERVNENRKESTKNHADLLGPALAMILLIFVGHFYVKPADDTAHPSPRPSKVVIPTKKPTAKVLSSREVNEADMKALYGELKYLSKNRTKLTEVSARRDFLLRWYLKLSPKDRERAISDQGMKDIMELAVQSPEKARQPIDETLARFFNWAATKIPRE